MSIEIRSAGVEDIAIIRKLTYEIWPVTYGNILSGEQLEYMLELIYSEQSLTEQINNGHHFIIVEEDKNPVAFADYQQIEPSIYKLNKIYALPNQQGKGLGKLMMNYVITEAKANGATALRLNVNRHNKAKAFYEHNGFAVIYEDDIGIGNGYFMNDYIMEKKLV